MCKYRSNVLKHSLVRYQTDHPISYIIIVMNKIVACSINVILVCFFLNMHTDVNPPTLAWLGKVDMISLGTELFSNVWIIFPIVIN